MTGTFSCSGKTLQNHFVDPIATSFYSYVRGSTVIPLDMEVDVRLLVLTILSVSIKAQDDGAKVNFTDKLGIHCLTCLRNISSAACRLLDNGTISCVKCKENLKDDLLCSDCAEGFDSNETTLQGSCDACMCNIGASQLKHPCDQANHKCFICRSNGTSLDCKGCSSNDHNVNSFIKNCVMEKDKVEAKKSGFSTKEKIIVAVCTTFGVGCLATTAFLIYRHFKSRHFPVKKPFWTVELTNRNYDDLDFSLLDPITDIPFVYRTDMDEFDNDALLGAEKPHLTMEVDGVDVVS